MLYVEIVSADILEHFHIFPIKQFDISCKSSPNVKCLLEKYVSSIYCLPKMPRVLTINFQQMTFFNSFLIFFSQETGFEISCTFSQLETVCMKCQILLAGKTQKI